MKAKCTDCNTEKVVYPPTWMKNRVEMGVAIFCPKCNRKTIFEFVTDEPEEYKLPPHLEGAVEQIDTAIFTGDCDGFKAVATLKEHCHRWLNGLSALDETAAEEDEDDEQL